MPPKKAGKGKGKGGDAAKPKMSKKEKKLWAKFGMVTAEGPDGKEASLPAFRRDELEWAVERLREQVTEQRSERIKYQLERDFLYELAEQYRKKLDCLILEQEALIAQNNKAAQDAEENKTIKGMEGKHFRAETQIMATQQECRDEIRRKKIKDMLEKSWHQISMDMDEQDEILRRNAEEYKKRIEETQKQLQDLHLYMEDHDKQLEEYMKNLEKEKQNSMTLFFVIRRMETQLSEERWDEFIWTLSHNFENSLKAMKNFYNDASFSNFTMMYTLQDMISSSVERMEQYSQKIKDLQAMMQEAHAQMPSLRVSFGRARIRHNRIVRTKQGIKTVLKELQLIQTKTNTLRVDYRQNFHRLENINAERTNFRTNGAELVQNVLDAYNNRFRIQDDLNKMQEAVDKKEEKKNKLMQHFKSPRQFRQCVQPFKETMLDKHELAEEYHLTSLKLKKQTENLRNSLDSRLRRIGLTRKHATIPPKYTSPFEPAVTGVPRALKNNWGPANLVAGTAYKKRRIPNDKGCEYEGRICELIERCPDEDVDTAVPACLTDSLQEFMNYQNKQREQRLYKKVQAQRLIKREEENRFYC